MDLAPVKAHIRQVCGLSFDAEKEVVLTGALRTRMTSVQCPSLDDYLGRVAVDPQEFQALVNLLTINETYFFRETPHIDLLTGHLLPRLLAKRETDRPIRILCAGCSTGEEPYTLSIALLETFGANAPRMFSVTAADIDSEVLARAEKAVYSGLSFRNLPKERVERWFSPYPPSRYRLNDVVRTMVSFRQLNLLEDFYPSDLSGQDIIIFRNVSIYFDVDVRRSVQIKLAGILNDGGALIVGLTETLPNDLGVFSLTVNQGVFYFVKTAQPQRPVPRAIPQAHRHRLAPAPPKPHKAVAAHRTSLAAADTPFKRTPIPARHVEALGTEPSLDAALTSVREKRYDDALAEIARLECRDPADSRPSVLRAHIAFNRKDMAAAKASAERALMQNEWDLDALLLLAQIARIGERTEEAVRMLKQAVYVQPQCWPAHYWLAEIYRGAGETDKAGREYRIVVNQTQADGEGGLGLLMFPLGVSPTDVGALCRRQLKSLGVE